MRCYNKIESLLYSKYIFSVITMYTIDFGNFNTDTHVKCITNRASSHSYEPFHFKAPSILYEGLFSVEEVWSYVVYCFQCRWNKTVSEHSTVTEQLYTTINTYPCYRELYCSIHTQGKKYKESPTLITQMSLSVSAGTVTLIVKNNYAINQSESEVSDIQTEALL